MVGVGRFCAEWLSGMKSSIWDGGNLQKYVKHGSRSLTFIFSAQPSGRATVQSFVRSGPLGAMPQAFAEAPCPGGSLVSSLYSKIERIFAPSSKTLMPQACRRARGFVVQSRPPTWFDKLTMRVEVALNLPHTKTAHTRAQTEKQMKHRIRITCLV